MGDRGNKQRKLELELCKDINCGRCPYHRRENIERRVPKERIPTKFVGKRGFGIQTPRKARRIKRGGKRADAI